MRVYVETRAREGFYRKYAPKSKGDLASLLAEN